MPIHKAVIRNGKPSFTVGFYKEFAKRVRWSNSENVYIWSGLAGDYPQDARVVYEQHNGETEDQIFNMHSNPFCIDRHYLTTSPKRGRQSARRGGANERIRDHNRNNKNMRCSQHAKRSNKQLWNTPDKYKISKDCQD